MGDVKIKRDESYGSSSVTIIGLTRHYGHPQYILVSTDGNQVKFPGLRFKPGRSGQTLEDVAYERFEEQTGLSITNRLGLRVILPAWSRNVTTLENGRRIRPWIFRHIFLGTADDVAERGENDAERRLYVANVGEGVHARGVNVREVGKAEMGKQHLRYASPADAEVAKIATSLANNLNWSNLETGWYHRIPCVGARQFLTDDSEYQPLGCGLAVASMVVAYREKPGSELKVILLKKKNDPNYLTLPGFPGGKIETPVRSRRGMVADYNEDPISCCMAEGAQELGFPIKPESIICCAHTGLHVPRTGGEHYVSIDNLAFTATPLSGSDVRRALRKPRKYLERDMGEYVVLSMPEFRELVDKRELRTPDMVEIGKEYFRTGPGEKPNLSHVRNSGMS